MKKTLFILPMICIVSLTGGCTKSANDIEQQSTEKTHQFVSEAAIASQDQQPSSLPSPSMTTTLEKNEDYQELVDGDAMFRDLFEDVLEEHWKGLLPDFPVYIWLMKDDMPKMPLRYVANKSFDEVYAFYKGLATSGDWVVIADKPDAGTNEAVLTLEDKNETRLYVFFNSFSDTIHDVWKNSEIESWGKEETDIVLWKVYKND